MQVIGDAFEGKLRARLELFPWRILLGHVSIVEVDTNVSILHLQITTDCRHRHDLLIFAPLLPIVPVFLADGVTVVHRIGGYVLESRLQPTIKQHILLEELYIAFFFLIPEQLVFFADRDGFERTVPCFVVVKGSSPHMIGGANGW